MTVMKKRRALSPIVAVVLMFLLITAAIGLAIGFMGPNLIRFKDKNYNNSNHLYFIGMDSTIQSLLYDSPGSAMEFLYVQQEGELSLTSDWLIIFILREGTTQSNIIFQENLSRIVHKSAYVTDYEIGEHRYLIGPQNQDYLAVNGSEKLYNDITILNESRTSTENGFLNLALYYRYTFSTKYYTQGISEYYDLDIIHVNLIFNSTKITFTNRFVNMVFTYNSTSIETSATYAVNEDITGELRYFDNYGKSYSEYPIYYTLNPNYSSHILNLRVININMIVTII